MRNFMSFIAAVILTAISTFVLGVVDNTYAKTAFLAYGGKSMSPNGTLANQKFDGAALGGGIRFGMGNRVSLGFDYFGQKATGETTHVSSYTGQTMIGLANFYGADISVFNVNPNAEYAYVDISENSQSKLMTGTVYISLNPEDTVSKRVVEPAVGLTFGINALQLETNSKAFYRPDLRGLESKIYGPVFGEGEEIHFKYDILFDDGSGSAKTSLNKYEFVYGGSFGLNFYIKNFVIAPEIGYLKKYGVIIKAVLGFRL